MAGAGNKQKRGRSRKRAVRSNLQPSPVALRVVHEAEAGASGALAGAAIGGAGGPVGAVAGAIVGGLVGTAVGAALEASRADYEAKKAAEAARCDHDDTEE